MKLVTLKDGRLARVEANQMMAFEHKGGMLALIQAGQAGLAAVQAETVNSQIEPFTLDLVAAPLSQPSKIIAIGKNYAEHAKESKSAVPTSPLIFTKFTTAIIGHGGVVTWREALTKQVDFEAELAVIIGQTAREVSETDALNYVFGYSCANDVTARDLQYGDKQWVRGKSLDTFCPLGPWIITKDEIPDPQTLDIRCIVNGEVMQSSNTSQMIFSVAQLISFASHAFTLLPGDIILTGTPDGVGFYREPPVFRQDNDEMIVEIDQVGQLINRCRKIN